MFDPMCGRELIVVDSLAALPTLRPKAVVPRVTSSLDSAKLCSMLGRSAHTNTPHLCLHRCVRSQSMRI